MTQAIINHIALLVPSVEKAADHLRPFDFKIGHAEQWEEKGTVGVRRRWTENIPADFHQEPSR